MRVFNVLNAELTYDPDDPPQYAAGAHRFGPQVGGARLGATVYELPPGTALCPYHYESEEEWLLVLAGAHKTTNNGTESVRMVMWANSDPIGYAAYPDSDKIAYWSDSSDERDGVRVRRGEKLPYYDGEL